MPSSPSSADGLIVSGHGRHVVVEDANAERVLCHVRGKRSVAVVGDRVRWQPSGDEGVIEAILPRQQPLLSPGRVEDEGVRRQHRSASGRRRRRAGVQRIAARSRAACRRRRSDSRPHRPQQARPADLRCRARAPAALRGDGRRHPGARAQGRSRRGPCAPRAAARRQGDAGARPERRRQEHARQPHGAGRAGRNRRDLEGAEHGTAHDDLDPLALARSRTDGRDHRFAGVPGVRPAPPGALLASPR